MKRKIVGVLLSFLVAIVMVVPSLFFAGCSRATSVKAFEFEQADNGYWEITKYIGKSKNVIIPSRYKGKDIVSIGENSFEDCKKLTRIKIPASIENIGVSAFTGCHNLKTVVIDSAIYGAIYSEEDQGCLIKYADKIYVLCSVVNKNESFYFENENYWIKSKGSGDYKDYYLFQENPNYK